MNWGSSFEITKLIRYVIVHTSSYSSYTNTFFSSNKVSNSKRTAAGWIFEKWMTVLRPEQWKVQYCRITTSEKRIFSSWWWGEAQDLLVFGHISSFPPLRTKAQVFSQVVTKQYHITFQKKPEAPHCGYSIWVPKTWDRMHSKHFSEVRKNISHESNILETIPYPQLFLCTKLSRSLRNEGMKRKCGSCVV